MGYTIEKSLTSGYSGNALKGKNLVIAHESGNPNNVGSDSLDNELTYMKDRINKANVSHWVGGGGRIVQILPTGKVQWGAGGKANPYSFAQVELARTNNAATFKKDYAAYIWLLRYLADQAGIPKTLDTGSRVTDKGIKTHRWVTDNLGNTTHVDPYGYLASMGISKEQFNSDVTKGLGVSTPIASYPTLSGTYTVKRGDTLWGIANTHKSTVNNIKSLNGLKSDLINEGQTLKLSKTATVVTKVAVSKPATKKYVLTTKVLKVTNPQMNGSEVEIVQQALSSIYYYPNKGAKNNGVDGCYGPNTQDAVKRFQLVFGLVVDGHFGPETRAKLDSLVNK